MHAVQLRLGKARSGLPISDNLTFTAFTALHAVQTRSSDENSVCLSVSPSVCLSVTRVDCDKTVEISVQIVVRCP